MKQDGILACTPALRTSGASIFAVAFTGWWRWHRSDLGEPHWRWPNSL